MKSIHVPLTPSSRLAEHGRGDLRLQSESQSRRPEGYALPDA